MIFGYTKRDIFGWLTIDVPKHRKKKKELEAHRAFIRMKRHATAWSIMAAAVLPVLPTIYV